MATAATKSIKVTANAKAPAAQKAAPKKVASPKEQVKADDFITINLPAGTTENTRWLVAPLSEGHTRWFDKNKIKGWTPLKDAKKGTGATVTLRRSELSYRGKTYREFAANA